MGVTWVLNLRAQKSAFKTRSAGSKWYITKLVPKVGVFYTGANFPCKIRLPIVLRLLFFMTVLNFFQTPFDESVQSKNNYSLDECKVWGPSEASVITVA